MTEVARLSVAIGADTSDLEKGSAKAQSIVQGFGGAMSSILAGIGQGIGQSVFSTITEGLGAIKSAAIDLNSSLEQSKIAFTTMLGSAENADKFLKELQQFAAKTPFEFPDLVDASKRMFAFGFESKQVVPLLTAVGNAVAAVGGGRDVINGVTLALGQMRAKGKVSAEEMGQLAERGIPAWEMLANKLGVDIPKAMEMTSKGLVKAETFIEAFQEGVEKKFGGMMEKQAVTFEGAMSTIKDSLNMATATAFKPFFDILSQGAIAFAEFLQGDEFSGWAQSVAAAISEVARLAQNAFVTIKQVLAGDWESDSSIDPIVDMIGNIALVLKEAYDTASNIIPRIVQTFQTLFALFQGDSIPLDDLRSLGDTLDEVFGPAISSMILDFVRLAGEAWRELVDSGTQLIGGFVSWFQENWPLIQEVVSESIQRIAQAWEEHGAEIVQIIQSTWTVVKTAIAQALDVIGSLTRAWYQLMNNDTQGAMDTLGGLFERSWERYKTAFQAGWDALYGIIELGSGNSLSATGEWLAQMEQSITAGMETTGNTVQSAWESIKSTTEQVLSSIQESIRAVWNLIPEDIRRDLDLVLNALSERGSAWVSSVAESGQAMLQSITSKLNEIAQYVQTWTTNSILEPLRRLVGASQATSESIGSAILQGITNKLSQTVQAVQTWATSTFLSPLRNLINSARDIARDIGEAIINGIISGVRSMGSHLGGILADIVRSALDRAKSALGIRSPSKVSEREVGEPIGQGVIAGVASQMPAFQDIMSDFVRPVNNTPLPVPSGTGLSAIRPSTSVVNNVTVYVQGHALVDKRALADAVVAGLEAAQQQSRTRVRVV